MPVVLGVGATEDVCPGVVLALRSPGVGQDGPPSGVPLGVPQEVLAQPVGVVTVSALLTSVVPFYTVWSSPGPCRGGRPCCDRARGPQ